MFSSVPAIAAAFPIRPPLARNSSVSTVKTIRLSRWNRAMNSSTPSSVVPRSSRCWIPSARRASPAETVPLSIARTFSPPSSSPAVRALSTVPESFSGRCSDRIRSYAASPS